MKFHSTRGQSPETDLRGVALAGLAPDGGLYLPVEWPRFSAEEIAAMRGLSYQEIAFRVLTPFMRDTIPAATLRTIIDKSYARFDSKDVTPVRSLGQGRHILELSLGPTLAFKDVALQLLGNTFEYLLRDADKRMTIITATSGDTGGAAIEAFANRANIDVFVLYPQTGPSDVQRKQMTCVDAANVHALAVDGDFDNCQAMVKEMFADKALRDEFNLTTVNSINLLRILAQVVYYFYAASRVEGKPTFVVPTGNFGDIFAGYAAWKCGLPVEKLVVASNSNDILYRFFQSGKMEILGATTTTTSPSMDIQVSSNFERLLFDLCGGDSARLRDLMGQLKAKGSFAVTPEEMAKAQALFAAGRADDGETKATIKRIWNEYHDLIDPHTAVGVKVSDDLRGALKAPVVCLSTAHPAKFPDTVREAAGQVAPLPAAVEALFAKPERTSLLPVDVARFVAYIKDHRL